MPEGQMSGEDPHAAWRVASEAGPHLAMGAAGVGAAVLRMATYTGPPRPWKAVLLDGLAQVLVGYSVAALALWATGSAHAALGAGIGSGLLGWEMLKRYAAGRIGQKPNGG